MTFLLGTLIKILGAIPIQIRVVLGRSFGFLFSLFPSRDRAIAVAQLRVILGETEPTPLVGRMYANLGQSILESFNLKPLLEDPKSIVTDDWDEAKRVFADGRSVVVLTAHLGNWDLLGAYIVKNGYRVSTIGREANFGPLQSALNKLRSSYGVKTIWRSDKNGLRELMEEMKGGNIVAALMDQDTTVKSIPLPFLGRDAMTPVTLVELGKKLDTNFGTAFIVRERLNRYRVYMEQIDRSLSAEQILLEYHRRLEDLIKRYPDQWVWIHKRWRTLRDGTRRRSSDYLSDLLKEIE